MTTEQTTADIELIQRIIPHRYPFLLVDKVVDIDGRRNLRLASRMSPSTSHIFRAVSRPSDHARGNDRRGHGPDDRRDGRAVKGLVDTGFLVYFMAIDNCKFRRKVVPGDVLKLHVETKRGGGKIWKFAGRAMVDGELAAEAEFTAMMDLPKD